MLHLCKTVYCTSILSLSIAHRSSTILRALAASSFWRARRASSLTLIASSKKWLRSAMRAASRFLICSRSSSECTVVRFWNSSSCERSCVQARSIVYTWNNVSLGKIHILSRWAPSGRAARARTRSGHAQPRRRAYVPSAPAARPSPWRVAARWAPACAPPRPPSGATRAPPPPATASRAVHHARPARLAHAAAALADEPPRVPSRTWRAPAPSRRPPHAPMRRKLSQVIDLLICTRISDCVQWIERTTLFTGTYRLLALELENLQVEQLLLLLLLHLSLDHVVVGAVKFLLKKFATCSK